MYFYWYDYRKFIFTDAAAETRISPIRDSVTIIMVFLLVLAMLYNTQDYWTLDFYIVWYSKEQTQQN
jgi:hypothetical protein